MHFTFCVTNVFPKLNIETNTNLKNLRIICIMFLIKYSWILSIFFVRSTP